MKKGFTNSVVISYDSGVLSVTENLIRKIARKNHSVGYHLLLDGIFMNRNKHKEEVYHFRTKVSAQKFSKEVKLFMKLLHSTSKNVKLKIW